MVSKNICSQIALELGSIELYVPLFLHNEKKMF